MFLDEGKATCPAKVQIGNSTGDFLSGTAQADERLSVANLKPSRGAAEGRVRTYTRTWDFISVFLRLCKPYPPSFRDEDASLAMQYEQSIDYWRQYLAVAQYVQQLV